MTDEPCRAAAHRRARAGSRSGEHHGREQVLDAETVDSELFAAQVAEADDVDTSTTASAPVAPEIIPGRPPNERRDQPDQERAVEPD
jgi:hypothetical protein